MGPSSGHRAAVLDSPGHVSVTRVAMKHPGPDQVRVKLEGCGVCASNLPVWQGRPWFEYPMPPGSPGHEGWGVVDAVGDAVTQFSRGQRVAFMSQHAYAEYDIADEQAVVALPNELRDEPFPGEPLACAMNIFERSDIREGHTVAIVGAGFLGSLLTQLATGVGAIVMVLSRREYALSRASEAGASEVIELTDLERARARALGLTSGKGYQRVIEAVGEQSSLTLASDLVAEHGRLVIAGYHQDGLREINVQQWNWRGIDVVNAHERRISRYTDGMRRAIDAVLKGCLDPFPYITHSLPLESLDCAFELASKRPTGFMKAVLQMDRQAMGRHSASRQTLP
jgi:threonine dehydrogenase-like Zn-dependent dehydrogenase